MFKQVNGIEVELSLQEELEFNCREEAHLAELDNRLREELILAARNKAVDSLISEEIKSINSMDSGQLHAARTGP